MSLNRKQPRMAARNNRLPYPRHGRGIDEAPPLARPAPSHRRVDAAWLLVLGATAVVLIIVLVMLR